MDAFAACMEKAEKLFPQVSNDPSLDNKAGEMKANNWRIGPDAHFVLEVPSVASDRMSQNLFTCAGNSKRRVVEMIELDGVLKRPAIGETWSY